MVYSCSTKEEESKLKARTQYTLTVSAEQEETISPDANGTYNEGATITFTATPNNGYVFHR